MIQIQWLSALLMVVGVISSAVLIIANYRKINREQFAASNAEWTNAVNALKEHNNALKERLDDLEVEQNRRDATIERLTGQCTTMDSEKRRLESELIQLTRRNVSLYEMAQNLRETLKRSGLPAGPEPNGET